jgi:hypothetical protein
VPEPVTRLLYRPKCERAVSLSYRPSDAYAAQAWTCHYVGCQTLHTVALYATQLVAIARVALPNPQAPHGAESLHGCDSHQKLCTTNGDPALHAH